MLPDVLVSVADVPAVMLESVMAPDVCVMETLPLAALAVMGAAPEVLMPVMLPLAALSERLAAAFTAFPVTPITQPVDADSVADVPEIDVTLMVPVLLRPTAPPVLAAFTTQSVPVLEMLMQVPAVALSAPTWVERGPMLAAADSVADAPAMRVPLMLPVWDVRDTLPVTALKVQNVTAPLAIKSIDPLAVADPP